MHYRMNLGDLNLPDDWKDETMHIINAPAGYNLVISTEAVPQGVSAESHIKAQQALFAENLPDYEETDRRAIAFAGATWPLLTYEWTSDGNKMHQINLMVIRDNTLTSFTFSHTEPFSEADTQTIHTLLKEFNVVNLADTGGH